MTVVMFPDNTVLINLAHINRVALLASLFENRQWCATVAGECSASERATGLADLNTARTVFGAPIYPDRIEHIDARILREAMAKPGDGPHQHLGEAETIAIVTKRRINAVFITDDASAATRAKAAGISVADTWRILQIAHKAKHLTADQVWADCWTLSNNKRGWPPCGRSRADFDTWLMR